MDGVKEKNSLLKMWYEGIRQERFVAQNVLFKKIETVYWALDTSENDFIQGVQSSLTGTYPCEVHSRAKCPACPHL